MQNSSRKQEVMPSITCTELVREYFPNADDDTIGYLLWNETGFPGFWNIGTDGDTPEECLRMQLARAAARENFGEYGYLDSDQELDRLQCDA